jgi:hypothetical protein
VEAVEPDVVVPVHWDDFTKKLSEGLEVPPRIMGNTTVAMQFVKDKANHRKVRIMDHREALYLRDGTVYVPPPLVPVGECPPVEIGKLLSKQTARPR